MSDPGVATSDITTANPPPSANDCPSSPTPLQCLHQAAVLLSDPGTATGATTSINPLPTIKGRPSTFPEHFRTTQQEIIEKVVEIFNRPTIALSPRSAQAILEVHAGTAVEQKVNETVTRGLVTTLIK